MSPQFAPSDPLVPGIIPASLFSGARVMRRGSDQDVAELLGISVDRLRKRIQGDELVPPYIHIPGTKSRIWDMDEVEGWMRGFRRTPLSVVPTLAHAAPPVKRGRGRPPKTAYRT